MPEYPQHSQDPAPHSARSIVLTVSEVIWETPQACSLVFDIPEHARERFMFRPGQFLTVRIPSARTGSVARCYSLASSPHTGEAPKITIKRTDGGYGSHWICDNVQPGDCLEVLPPSGLFSPDDLGQDFLLFAGGSGITPVMSIIESVLVAGTGTITLFYANRDEESVIFAQALRDLSERHPTRLVVSHWLDRLQGFPSPDQIAAFASAYLSCEVFICGPTPFMDAVNKALGDLGADRRRVHTEVFTSLASDPFANVALTGDDTDAATVRVLLDGQRRELRWPRAHTLVEVMLAADIDVPYSCQEGECGSCMCTLISGEVRMDVSDLLDPEDVENGYILGCQARPVTAEVEIEF